MFKLLLKNIIFKKVYCTVEHTTLDQDSQINLLLLKKQKEEFIIEKEVTKAKIDQIFKYLKKKQHMFLIVNDEQVLSKKIKGKLHDHKAVYSAFPNLNIDDFYHEYYHSEQHTFVSICRKEYIDKIIEQYKAVNYYIIDFSLGNLNSTQLLSFVDNSELCTSNAKLSFKNKKLVDITKTKTILNKIYTINDLKIRNSSILPLSGILSYYTDQSTTHKSFPEEKIELLDQFRQKRVFDIGLRSGLSIILILLLVNFLIFNGYREQIHNLNVEIETNTNNRMNLLSLQKEVEKKKKIVSDINAAETSEVSFHLDKLGVSTPNTVLLMQLNYQPVSQTIKKNKELQYQYLQILIKGKSTNGDNFSNWINTLEEEKWIKSISVVNYGLGKKTTTEFLIKILLKQ